MADQDDVEDDAEDDVENEAEVEEEDDDSFLHRGPTSSADAADYGY